MEKYITKTTQATPTSNSLRCTIPKEIVDALEIKNGDSIKWMLSDNNEVLIEKLEL